MMPGSPMNMYATPSIRAMPPIAVVWPCQNSCQVAGETVAGSQVLTYGPRTTSGAAGGRIGVAARFPVAAAVSRLGVTAAAGLGGARTPAPAMVPARPPTAATPPENRRKSRLRGRYPAESGLTRAGATGEGSVTEMLT